MNGGYFWVFRGHQSYYKVTVKLFVNVVKELDATLTMGDRTGRWLSSLFSWKLTFAVCVLPASKVSSC